jgi:hypothetical protein
VWTTPLLATGVLLVLSAFFVAAIAAACRIKITAALAGLLTLLIARARLVTLLTALLITQFAR